MKSVFKWFLLTVFLISSYSGFADLKGDIEFVSEQIQRLRKSIAMEELFASRAAHYIESIENHIDPADRDLKTIEFLTEMRNKYAVSKEKLEHSWELYNQTLKKLDHLKKEESRFHEGDDIEADQIVALELERPQTAREKLFNSSSGFEGFIELKEKEDARNDEFKSMVEDLNATEEFSKELEVVANAADQRVYSLYYSIEQRRKINPFIQLPPPPEGYEDYRKQMQERAISNNPNVAVDADNAAGSESENNMEMARELRELAEKEEDAEKKRLYIEEAERLEKEAPVK